MFWQSATQWLIVAGVLVYVVWDVLAWRFGGANGQATESTAVGTWLDQSLWLTAAVAGLVAHLYASGQRGITPKHLAIAIAAGILAYLLTRSAF